MDTATDLDAQLAELDAAFDAARSAVLRVEVARCGVDELGRVRGRVLRLRNVLDGVNADLSRRAAQLREAGGDTAAVDDAINPDHRQPPKVEDDENDRAGVFEQIPGLEDATKQGDLPGAYADIVAKALSDVSQEVRSEFVGRHQNLAEIAAGMTQHAFRLHIQHLVEQALHDCGVQRVTRQRQNRRASRWSDIADGMWAMKGRWDPETGARMNSALDAEVDAI